MDMPVLRQRAIIEQPLRASIALRAIMSLHVSIFAFYST